MVDNRQVAANMHVHPNGVPAQADADNDSVSVIFSAFSGRYVTSQAAVALLGAWTPLGKPCGLQSWAGPTLQPRVKGTP